MSDNGGDRELVLGNKQLLAIFFVAALLCGVFFAVGYVVGGNSAKAGLSTGTDSTASTQSTDGKREEPTGQPSSAMDSAGSTPAPATGTPETGATLPGAEPHMADNPAAMGSAPVAAAPVTPPASTPAPAVSQPVSSVPYSKAAPANSAAAGSAPATGVFLSEPEKGTTYWQVAAERRPEADGVVQALRERHLPAILAASSNASLFRVLVGPYRTPLALADAKRKLTDLSFNGLVVTKY